MSSKDELKEIQKIICAAMEPGAMLGEATRDRYLEAMTPERAEALLRMYQYFMIYDKAPNGTPHHYVDLQSAAIDFTMLLSGNPDEEEQPEVAPGGVIFTPDPHTPEGIEFFERTRVGGSQAVEEQAPKLEDYTILASFDPSGVLVLSVLEVPGCAIAEKDANAAFARLRESFVVLARQYEEYGKELPRPLDSKELQTWLKRVQESL